MGNVVGGAIALIVGGALATATFMGFINAQTSANNDQPVSRVMDYGTTNQ